MLPQSIDGMRPTTYQTEPTIIDADGNLVNKSSFDVARAYVNITGNLSHIVAFRITPDVSRETNAASSLAGSLEFRIKYAYLQTNFDDWMPKGSYARFGVQQTPYLDYTEGIYRYRFQGTIFPERVGLMSSADAGVSGHYNFANNYGDIHAGFYNGENYNKAEVNNQKGFEARATFRPLPLGGPWLKGLRITGFVIEDHYVESAKRQRAIGQMALGKAAHAVGESEDIGCVDEPARYDRCGVDEKPTAREGAGIATG